MERFGRLGKLKKKYLQTATKHPFPSIPANIIHYYYNMMTFPSTLSNLSSRIKLIFY